MSALREANREKLQAPTSKHQRSSKLKIPKSTQQRRSRHDKFACRENDDPRRGFRRLEIGISLVFGAWILVFCKPVAHFQKKLLFLTRSIPRILPILLRNAVKEFFSAQIKFVVRQRRRCAEGVIETVEGQHGIFPVVTRRTC